jgi:DNA-directed RNA polymerase subunit RPC12/RpoP
MADAYVCWKCSAEQQELLLPLARLAECPQCRAQLHVCRMCRYFDTRAAQQCREPVADLVTDKQRANFCGYFQIMPNAFAATSAAAVASRSQLDTLFGGSAAPAAGDRSPEEQARDRLEQLFRK